MGYVFILVMMLASYLEYRARQGLKQYGQVVHLPGNKKTDTPSIMTIMEILAKMEVVVIQGQHLFPSSLDRQALEMVKWIGYDPLIYLKTNDFSN